MNEIKPMKQTLSLLVWIVAWALPGAWAAEAVPSSQDLRKDAAAARGINGAVLVAFVGEQCSYCERVLRDFLVPMSQNGEYRNKVVMRRIDTRSHANLRGFNGEDTTPSEFAAANGIRLTPTIVVFDEKGQRLGKPLIGLTTVDYYGYYLDQTIDTALEKIRKLGK
jgi:thioredoxin-related protein